MWVAVCVEISRRKSPTSCWQSCVGHCTWLIRWFSEVFRTSRVHLSGKFIFTPQLVNNYLLFFYNWLVISAFSIMTLQSAKRPFCSKHFFQWQTCPCFYIIQPCCSMSASCLFSLRRVSYHFLFQAVTADFLMMWPKKPNFLLTTDSRRLLSVCLL